MLPSFSESGQGSNVCYNPARAKDVQFVNERQGDQLKCLGVAVHVASGVLHVCILPLQNAQVNLALQSCQALRMLHQGAISHVDTNNAGHQSQISGIRI
jgi:hypothetical protein